MATAQQEHELQEPTVTTSRDWILPARPKPGRKPSTQIPPTKRKAQNREAQRAFRERKQARVAELESALRELQIEHAKKVDDLEGVLVRCRHERDHYRDLVRGMLSTSPAASIMHEGEDHGRNNSDRMDVTLNRINGLNAMNGDMNTGLDRGLVGQSVPLRRNRPENTLTTDGRGDTKRPKLMRFSQSDTTNLRHPPPPPPPFSINTNPTPSMSSTMTAADREIDFTTPAAPSSRDGTGYRSVESCGFCSEGTPCVCAEAAAATIIDDHQRFSSTLPSNAIATSGSASGVLSRGGYGPLDVSTIYRPRQYLPLPTSGDTNPSPTKEPRIDRTTATTNANANANTNTSTNVNTSDGGPGCTGKPGSCGQCEMDPMSTLFCKTLAANSTPSSSALSQAGNAVNAGHVGMWDGYGRQHGMRQLLPRSDHPTQPQTQTQRQGDGENQRAVGVGVGAGGHHRTRSDSAMDTAQFRKSHEIPRPPDSSSSLIPFPTSPSTTTAPSHQASSNLNANSNAPSHSNAGGSKSNALRQPRPYTSLVSHPYGSTPCPSGWAIQPPPLPSPVLLQQSPSAHSFSTHTHTPTHTDESASTGTTTTGTTGTSGTTGGETYLPCSAVYQTLSRHQGFGRADLGLLVRDLKVNTGLGVEVGSVRDVLRLLDRNLGRDI